MDSKVPPKNDEPSAEMLAQGLKAKNKPLGSAGELVQGIEPAPIAWETSASEPVLGDEASGRDSSAPAPAVSKAPHEALRPTAPASTSSTHPPTITPVANTETSEGDAPAPVATVTPIAPALGDEWLGRPETGATERHAPALAGGAPADADTGLQALVPPPQAASTLRQDPTQGTLGATGAMNPAGAIGTPVMPAIAAVATAAGHQALRTGGERSGTVTEDGLSQAQGTLSVTAGPPGAKQWSLAATAGRFGELQLDPHGHWHYQLDGTKPQVQALREGEVAVEHFTAFARDTLTGQTQAVRLSITVKGSNDAALISGVSKGSVTENLQPQCSGKLDISDVDQGEAQMRAGDLSGQYGTLHLAADGQWTYTLSPSTSKLLAAGTALSENLSVHALDGTAHVITVAIAGSNDAPLMALLPPLAAIEGGSVVSGQLSASDADPGDTLSFSLGQPVAGFQLNADGSYHFDPSDPAYEHLQAGEALTLNVPVIVTDSHGAQDSQRLQITLTGSNNAPTLQLTPLSTQEDAAVLQGQIIGADKDRGDTLSYSSATATPGFTIQADGSYRFDPADAAYQHLAAGQTQDVLIPITVTDSAGASHTANLLITVSGSNDAPGIASTHANAHLLREDAATTSVSGQLYSHDADSSDTLSWRLVGSGQGHFGQLRFDPHTQAWTYQLDNSRPETDALRAGQRAEDVFQITATDSAGASASTTIRIAITGSNDAPVLLAQSQSVSEDGALLRGQMQASDVDTGDRLSFGLSQAVAGFTLNADGSYSFDPADPAYQHLAAGQTQTLSIPITVTDSAGATHTQDLTLTLSGRNDGATIAGLDLGITREDTALIASGQLSLSDVDDGQAHFIAQSNTAGHYGSFSLDESGQWRYQLDNSRPEVQALKDGESLSDTLTVLSADGSSHTLTITVQGSNDAPVLAAQSQTVSEDGAQLYGQMLASDIDQGGSQTFSLAHPVDGFTLNVDGSYSFDPSHASYQLLKPGQTQDVVIPITVTDSAGASSTQNLTITVTGANDRALISGTDSGHIREGDASAITGRLRIQDADSGEAHFAELRHAPGQYGVLELGADGRWAYALDNSNSLVQGLKTGEQLVDHVLVQSLDGSSHQIEITIDGKDNGAVIGGVDAVVLTEDQATQNGFFVVSQQLSIADPDRGQDHFIARSRVLGHFGVFTLSEQGDWTYVTDNTLTRIQELKQGLTLTDRFVAMSADGTQHTITVTLTGTNDVPVLHAQTQAVSEDGTALHGQMMAFDVDLGDTQTFSQAHAVEGFTLNADGTYSFDPSAAAYQHLAAGQTQTLTIPITVTDSAGASNTQSLTITLTGSNDGAIIGGLSAGSTGEDSPQLTTGQLTVADVDDGEAHFIAQTASAGQYGHFSLDENGQWSYQLDNSRPEVQALKSGDSVTDRFTVTSADGTSQHVSITITGKDDAAVIAGTDTGSVTEDQAATLSTSGQLTITDPDAGQASFAAQTNVAGSYGQFSIDAAGHWRYSADNSQSAIQALKAGTSLNEQFTVSSADGTTHTVTVTIQGTNDAPVLQAQSQAVSEDGSALHGHMVASDVDVGDSQRFSLAHAVDGLTLNADGSYSFDPSHAAYQHLAAGQAQALTIPVTVTDSAGASSTQQLTITLTGTNDGATIGGVSTGSTTEDSALLTTGQLTVTDADDGQAHFVAQTSTAGAYGSFALDESGHWRYQLDNSKPEVQALKSGDNVNEHFTVTTVDGSSQQVTVTIAGQDDRAVIAGTDSGRLTEDQGTQGGFFLIAERLTVLDPDQGEAEFVPRARVLGHYGVFTLSAQGDWTYVADNSLDRIQHLKQGDTLTDSFVAHSVDGSAHTVTVTITGSNDAPALTASSTSPADLGTTLEDTPKHFSEADLLRLVGASDADGDALHITAIHVDAAYGSFAQEHDGSWTFTPVANAHHLDIPLTLSVSDGQATTQAQATLDIKSVTDAATPSLSVMAEQHVIQFGDAGAPAIYTTGGIQSGGDLGDFAIEMTVVGGSQVAVQGHNGPTLISYATAADMNAMYLWRPENLQLHLGGRDYDTGVDISHDTGSHRYGFVWNGAAGSFDVLRDGQIVKHLENVAKGGSLTGGGVMAFGNDQDSLGGGYAPEDAWHGQLFSASMAKGVSAAAMTQHALRDLATGSNLIMDVQAQGRQVVDLTGHHSFATSGPVTTPTTQVDTRIANPNPGALLHLSAHVGAPADPDDHVSAVAIKGFSAGTELSDGQGHSYLIHGPADAADITHWNLAGLTAQLPAGSHVGAHVVLEVTTTGPDGHVTTTASGAQGVTLNDAGDPVTTEVSIQLDIAPTDSPALISGQDHGGVTEDAGVSAAGVLEARGHLSIQDPDPGQAVFVPQSGTPANYGRFSIDAHGNWDYLADNQHPDIQALGQGETLTDLLQVSSPDGTQHTISITIQGTNDAPVLQAQSQSVLEDGSALHGQMLASDVDQGDTQSFSLAQAVDGFTLNADGSYSFDPSHASYQHLAQGQTQTLNIPITVTDSAGASSTEHLTITLTGTNDGATLGGDNTGSTSEDSTQLTTGQLSISDADDGEAHFIAQTGSTGSYGQFTLDENGQWSYQLDNSKPELQALKTGDSVTDSFTVTSADGTSQQVTVTITGKDDGAVIAGTDTGTVAEDQAATLSTGGQLTITDADAGQAHFIAQTSAAGSYGHFSLDDTGHWNYSADNSQAALQQLKAGATLSDSFTATSADGSTHTVTVTLTGTNDAPVLQAQSQSVLEDGTALHGQMVATDVDQGDTQTFSLAQAVDGFTLNADGSYSFDPSHAAYQHLAAGQTQTLTIPVTATDSAGASSTQSLTITLTGTNDGATLGGVHIGSTLEDKPDAVTGQLTVADVDDGEAHFVAQTGTAGTYGSFSLDDNGQWRYQLDNSKPELQALKSGDSVTDSFTVTSADGSTQQVTVTINGQDDHAVIAGTDSGSVAEDQSATLNTSGQLTITDPDAGQAHFTAQAQVAGSYGHFSLSEDGQWRYSADSSQSAIQQLKAGDSLSEHFTVHSADGTAHTVTITLQGTNDAPVLQAQHQSVSEDGSLLQGQMVASDVDQGDTQTFSIAQAVDGFTLNADGSYSFDPANAAYQQLAAGQTQDLVIPVTVTDSAGASHTQNLTITITGTNDGAVIGGVFTGAVTEDQAVQSGQLQASGQLSITDVDSGENHFIPQTDVLGSYGLGRFSLDAQGHWSYSADNSQKAIQQLAAGATLNDSFTVQGADGAQHTVTVTLTGTNDAPQFHLQVAPDYHPELESNDVLPLIISNIGFTRVAQYLDIQQILQGQAPIGAYANTCVTVSLGGLALIRPDGQAAQVFAPGQEFKLQALVDWQQQGPGHEFRVFGPKGTTGLNLSFHDAGDPNHITGPQGQASLYVNQVHIWPPFQAWQASASTATNSGLLTATEGGAALSGQFHASDIDVGDTLSYSLGQPVDGFTLNADGSYSFDPAHPSYQHLAAGQSETLSIPITVTDSAGASSTQTLTILLRGANDAATFGGVETGATQEDRPDALSGQLTVADADDGEAHFIAQSGTAGSYGQFSLDENGQWHYQIDNSRPEVQALRDGQNVIDSFTVRSADGTAHTVNISIAGKNDAALITGEDHQTLTEDQNVSGGQLIAQGQLHASTPDAGGDQFTPLSDLAGKFGRLSLSADGGWVYKADNSSAAVQGLSAGQSATESFTVHSVDGTAHTISLTIQGADEPRHDIWSSIVSAIKSNWAPYNLIGQRIDAGDSGALGSMRLAFNSGNPSVVDANGHVLASGSDLGMFGHDISIGQVVDLLKSHPGARLVLDGNVGSNSGFYLHDSGNAAELHFNGLSHYNVWSSPLGQVPIDGLPTPLSAAGAVPDASDSLTISVTDISVDHAGQLQTSGQLSISDADAGENHFNAQKEVAGTYGSFSIDASGHWVYSVDNGQAAVQNLQAGAQLTDSFMVTSADGTSHVVSVAVYGKNDAPVLFAQAQAVSEDGALLSGQMHASDADVGDTLSFRIDQPVAGFTLNADGSYRFDPSNAAYQHLAEGQTETLVIPVFVTDSMGASSVQDLTITLTGKNDATVITGDDHQTVTEDQNVDGYGNLHVTGQLHADDPDGTAGLLQFQQQNAVQASYGRFTLNADGYWLYEADNKNPAIQQLKTGESLTDTLTAHSADGTPHTITVTIQGQDDAAAFVPQAQGATVSSADIYTTFGVQLLSSEHREFEFVAEVLLGNLDPRSYATAEMSFTNAGVALRAPDGRLSTIYQAEGGMTTVPLMALRDWHNQGQGYDVVLVNATGMPVNVFPHDAGAPDKMSGFNPYVTGFSGPVNAAVVLYPDMQAASSGGAAQGSAVVPAMAPVLYDAAHVLEDKGQQISGFIEVQDADQGQSSMQAMNDHPAAHGTFSIDVNGDWVYKLDSSRPDVQALKAGETLLETITVHSADGTPHTVSITIHGQNDGAVISGADNGRVIEDQQITAAGRIETQGQLLLADADAGEAAFVAQPNAAGSYGTFSLDEDGHWHYSADNGQAAIQQLKAGATLSDSFTVHSADGTAHTVSVTITGSNDVPVLTAQSQALDGGGALYQGHMRATDTDVDDALSFSTTATVAGFTLHADGSYQFDPSDVAYQHLASGQSQKVLIPITVTDSAGATSTQNLTFTVTSATHGAVISGVDSGGLSEDGSSTVASGQLSIIDPDAGEAHFIAQANVSAQHGHFTLQDNGAWTYTLDNKSAAVQALKTGESFSEHLTVQSVDGSTHVLTVTVQGSNDAPVLQAQSQSVTEDGSQLHGKMVAQDADHGDALRFSTPNAVGGFTLNADGSYSFDPSHHDYQSLGAGQTRDIAIPITVTDSAGATATQMLNVHITGRDDRTSIYGVDSGSVQAVVHPETSGDLHASDDDAGQSGFRAGTFNGSFGRLSIDAQGHWSYRVDGSDPFVMHLLPNSHITEQLTVHSVDGTAHDIEIEVSGPPGGNQLSAPADSANVQHVALPQVWNALQAQTGANQGGHEVFAGIQAAVRAAGYQFQGLADELDKGHASTFAHLDISIAGARVQVLDAAGHLVQSVTPTAENAATLHMSDVLNWHAQGYSILASSESGLDSARMWLHNTGDMHNIQVILPDGTGFNAWTGEYTFGELHLHDTPPPAPPAPPETLLPPPAAPWTTADAGHAQAMDFINPALSADHLASGGVAPAHALAQAPTQEAVHADGSLAAHGMAAAPSPVDDYLHFAAQLSGGADGLAMHEPAQNFEHSPLRDYLAAAGLDPSVLSHEAAHLPPTELLIDALHPADESHTSGANEHDQSLHDAVLVEVPDPTHQEDPQHHGI